MPLPLQWLVVSCTGVLSPDNDTQVNINPTRIRRCIAQCSTLLHFAPDTKLTALQSGAQPPFLRAGSPTGVMPPE